MKDPKSQIQTIRDKLESGERGGSEADRDVLLAFSDELELRGSQYSDYRHLKLLRHNTRIAEEVGGVAEALENREAAEDIVRWINRTYDNEETNRDYRVALRVLGKHLNGSSGEPPDSLEWVPSSTSSTYDPSPEPSKMLRWEEDVLPMIEAAHNPRDKAMIALAFDLGPRGGEFENIQYGDVTEGDHGLRVTVRGKQGKRTATIIPAGPYVSRWLEEHPGGDPADPMWSKLSKPEAVSYQMLNKAFKQAAERAEVTKPVTFTNFRKSSAAHLASKGVNQAHLEEHHGWVRGSKVASRYVSVFAEEASREIARAYGKKIEPQESDDISPVECPRCGKETPSERDLCVWCGMAIKPGAAEKAEAIDSLLVNAIAQASGERAAELVKAREESKNDPELRAELIENVAPLLDREDSL